MAELGLDGSGHRVLRDFALQSDRLPHRKEQNQTSSHAQQQDAQICTSHPSFIDFQGQALPRPEQHAVEIHNSEF